MQRRQLLKLAPLAALAVLPIQTEGAQPVAYEIKPEKKYIFVFDPDEMEEKEAEAFAKIAHEAGLRGMLWFNKRREMTIYEVDA